MMGQNDAFTRLSVSSILFTNWCQKCFKVAPTLSIYIYVLYLTFASLKNEDEIKWKKREHGICFCVAIDVVKTSCIYDNPGRRF